MKSFVVIFGTVIAYMLLMLYTGTVLYIISGVLACAAQDSCSQEPFTPGIIFVVTTVGGLVSALVVSKLTITKPGENPGIIRSLQDASESAQKYSTILAIAYLAVWLITGLAALIVGVMMHPNINSTLSDIGTNWLGLAVASGYAYFGLDPTT